MYFNIYTYFKYGWELIDINTNQLQQLMYNKKFGILNNEFLWIETKSNYQKVYKIHNGKVYQTLVKKIGKRKNMQYEICW